MSLAPIDESKVACKLHLSSISHEHGSIWGLGFNSPIMETQMEKKMDNEMETAVDGVIEGLNELKSKLLQGGYIGDCIGDCSIEVIKGDTRRFDCGPHGVTIVPAYMVR